MVTERRKLARKDFTYYMRVLEESSGMLVGQIMDISTGGFKIESDEPIPVGAVMKLRIDQTNELAHKSHIAFSARVRWCQRDPYDPAYYNVGFQLLDMSPADYGIFVKMFNAYGTERRAQRRNNADYLWK